MQKIDQTVFKETKYIALWTLVFSAVMQAVFLVINMWDYTVLLGNLLGASAAVLNYFGIGLSVQRALEKEPKDAKQSMRLSSSARMLFLFCVAIVGVTLPCFHRVASLVPLLFPRVAIAFRMLGNKKQVEEGENEE